MAEEEKKPDFNEAFKAKEGSFLEILKASVGAKNISPIEAYNAAMKDLEPKLTRAKSLLTGKTFPEYGFPVYNLFVSECVWMDGKIVGGTMPAVKLDPYNTLEIYVFIEKSKGDYVEVLLEDFLLKTGQRL